MIRTALADSLFGLGGNDVLQGLAGKSGNDTLISSTDADTFEFVPLLEGIDTIQDFSVKQGDKIEVSAARFGVAVNDTSKFSSSNNTFFFNTTAVAIFQPNSGFSTGTNIKVV
ncbi:hypothetical protein [Gloeocapsopsis sp. IPPAS B-1203]|uniref:hypothetical protein n=1 Tax=Gloeocapsopsis sp. IPPAS B-1203 TaxID=2049454 RepID=UPI000C1926BC|nr:hypothetical protein [Gloeocapsopsis sp. IPPAS B-1203]PIG92469.1 hypothetical protein CSQ79_15370 [Gloeocapsopsis sp. IPPAS B-1203]